MSRDLNGNYTLPAGNPVAPGTVIVAAWANPTMDDIGAALTDSLSRSGQGGMLVPFKNASGTAANPGMTWADEPSSGWYRAAFQDFRYAISSADIFQITINGINIAAGKTAPWPASALLLAKGSIYAASAAGVVAALAVGGDGLVLQADATQPLGVKWASINAVVDVPRTWVTPQRAAHVVTAPVGTCDMTAGNDFTCQVIAASQLTFTNLVDGQRGMIQWNNTGNFAATFGAMVRKGTTAIADLSLTGTRVVSYWCVGAVVDIAYSEILS